MTKEFHVDSIGGDDTADGTSVGAFKTIERGLNERKPDVNPVLLLRGTFDEHPILLSGVKLIGEGRDKTAIQSDITSVNDGRVVTIAGNDVEIDGFRIWDKRIVDQSVRVPLGIRGVVRGFVARGIHIEGVTDGAILHGNNNELTFIDCDWTCEQDHIVMLAGDGSTVIRFTRNRWLSRGSARSATAAFRAGGVTAFFKECRMDLSNLLSLPFGVLGIGAHPGVGNASTRFDIEDSDILTDAPNGGTNAAIDMSAGADIGVGGKATVRGGSIDRSRVSGNVVFEDAVPVPTPTLPISISATVVKKGKRHTVVVTLRSPIYPFSYVVKVSRPINGPSYEKVGDSNAETIFLSFSLSPKAPSGTWVAEVTAKVAGHIDGHNSVTFQV